MPSLSGDSGQKFLAFSDSVKGGRLGLPTNLIMWRIWNSGKKQFSCYQPKIGTEVHCIFPVGPVSLCEWFYLSLLWDIYYVGRQFWLSQVEEILLSSSSWRGREAANTLLCTGQLPTTNDDMAQMVQCQDEKTLCEPESTMWMGTLSGFSHGCVLTAIKRLYVLNKQKKKGVFIDVLDCPLVLIAKGQSDHFYLLLTFSWPPWFLTQGYPWIRNLEQWILLKWINSGWNPESKQCQQSSQ